ncbi:hypothetical protein ACH5RR_018317 [Cinchona calisaya]|uniref:CCHC-type domain-containing protein n=1 Tax=Cinchona calisaya TaxID=153742 RepID=A0ABD2ZLJ5_9GENT
MLVEVDLNKPLLRGTIVRFCYHCGHIGHLERNCSHRNNPQKGVDESQFGSWLKAGTWRRQINSVKTPINRIAENVNTGKNWNQERIREDENTNPRIAITQENDALGPDQRSSKTDEGLEGY